MARWQNTIFDLTSTGICRGENVFSALEAIIPKAHWCATIFSPLFEDLAESFDTSLNGVITFWPLLEQCAVPLISVGHKNAAAGFTDKKQVNYINVVKKIVFFYTSAIWVSIYTFIDLWDHTSFNEKFGTS